LFEEFMRSGCCLEFISCSSYDLCILKFISCVGYDFVGKFWGKFFYFRVCEKKRGNVLVYEEGKPKRETIGGIIQFSH
jgi:hypothetical protein